MNKSLCALHLGVQMTAKEVAIRARLTHVMAARFYFWEEYAVPGGYSIMNKTGVGMQIIDSAKTLEIPRRQHMTAQQGAIRSSELMRDAKPDTGRTLAGTQAGNGIGGQVVTGSLLIVDLGKCAPQFSTF